MTPLDLERLSDALQLATKSVGLSDPNPRVGCVIGFAEGTVCGRGHTQEVGGAHAEVMALRDASSASASVVGATAWVSLEPCVHHGRTPPCCEALISAGIERVVVAVEDPYAKVAGRGIARLRAAGVHVEVAAADIAAAARELNIGFFSRVTRGKPWVRLKAAISLDGRTALHNGESQWITGEAARNDGHLWRKRAGAVLTGIGTVLHDDPRLDVRGVATHVQPLRIVLDSRWRTPLSARLLSPPGRALVVGTGAAPEQRRRLQEAGADTLAMAGDAQRVALPVLLDELARREVNELHVEAGAVLNAALLQGGHVDELLIYMAPKLLGDGASLADLGQLSHLTDGVDFRFQAIDRVGEDIRLRLVKTAR